MAQSRQFINKGKRRAVKGFAGLLTLIAVGLVIVILGSVFSFLPDSGRSSDYGQTASAMLFSEADFTAMKRSDLKAIVTELSNVPEAQRTSLQSHNLKLAEKAYSTYRDKDQKRMRQHYHQLKHAPSLKNLKNETMLVNHSYGDGKLTDAAVRIVPNSKSFVDRGKYDTFQADVYRGIAVEPSAVENRQSGDTVKFRTEPDGKKHKFKVAEGYAPVKGEKIPLSSKDGAPFDGYLKLSADGKYYLYKADGTRVETKVGTYALYALKGSCVGSGPSFEKIAEGKGTLKLLHKETIGDESYNTVIFDENGYITGMYRIGA